ncbi:MULTISPECIES: hypothetical protein [Micromonosporaceae]|uniref:hypothetical protein n=1 Tax=Micromonosporaceae TaxID=28056 RepID=UPI00241811EB|nr:MULTISPECIES: hypothetical protein [Micromonosporaceae]MDG4768733.1 hypothetical protein [Solwaraspora sp. WMMD792]MDG4768772.1 hypothetical protein [Solwaraspora sp. WMMD792]MDG4768814.1 hypothetical protein [Solwaraspora sp. WMMD792]MDG4768873.1 hypothetical protein [Solwaraspora sp. WMMD792]MDG4768903.1 hypothetical protein [Solwaraspora sp. WMMD792]
MPQTPTDPADPLQAAAGTRAGIEAALTGRHRSTVQIARHLAWSHLPPPLAAVSARIGSAVLDLVADLPDGPELTTAIRRAVEAKDCLVRAAVDATDEER